MATVNSSPTACVLIIGNEILSGRTQDINLNHIAKHLGEIGINLLEARMIPDIESTIIETVNECRKKYTYIFTTGGIGPTHDDITAESIAKAFGTSLYRHPDAQHRLEQQLKDRLNEAALKMADVPQGAQLIDNPLTAAPGFIMENVIVMAGIPEVMHGMLESVLPYLQKGEVVFSKSISCDLPESRIAPGLHLIQEENKEVDIGSYPHWPHEHLNLSIVVRGTDEKKVDQVLEDVTQLIHSLSGHPFPADFI